VHPPQNEPSAEALFADLLDRLDAGEGPDFEALCRQHPGRAAALRKTYVRWQAMAAAFEQLSQDDGGSADDRIEDRPGDRPGAAADSTSAAVSRWRNRSSGCRSSTWPRARDSSPSTDRPSDWVGRCASVPAAANSPSSPSTCSASMRTRAHASPSTISPPADPRRRTPPTAGSSPCCCAVARWRACSTSSPAASATRTSPRHGRRRSRRP